MQFFGKLANIGDRIFETIDWISVPEFRIRCRLWIRNSIGPIEMKYSGHQSSLKVSLGLALDSVLIAILLIIIPYSMKSPQEVCCKKKPQNDTINDRYK
jgi:hypothetical protein